MSDTTEPKLDQAAYASNGGFNCPVCGSDDVVDEGEVHVDDANAHQLRGCNACKAKWHDEYALTGYCLIE